MAVDPYSPCPCGSGQKFKWCCHKVEAHAEKAERLLDGGQIDAALAALDEGLKKSPGNPWLSVRKAVILIRRRQSATARGVLERVIADHPGHLGAQGLLARVLLEVEGPVAGVNQLQKAFEGADRDARRGLAIPAQLFGVVLGELGHAPSARKHFELALNLTGPDAEATRTLIQAIRTIEANPSLPPWLRQPEPLAQPPEGLDQATRESFYQALNHAADGLWRRAAGEFAALAAAGSVEALRNEGLCRLWSIDDKAAVAALRQYCARVGETPEAVDLEALCQLLTTPAESELLAQVHLIWTLRDRNGLMERLQASDRFDYGGTGPLDPDDPESFEVDQFEILDRPRPSSDQLPDDVKALPRVLARVLVGGEIAILEAFEDDRLDGLAALFTEVAGPAVPPAQPRTKELGKLPRHLVALRTDTWTPEDLDADRAAEIGRQQRAWVLEELWPATPMPYLNGRTPRQAASAGDATLALRAAICQFELDHIPWRDPIDFPALRRSLGVADEPEPDPDTMDVDELHLARLHRVPAERLDDDKLVALYLRARRALLPLALERSARALAERPTLLSRGEVGWVPVHADLVNLALSRQDAGQARMWLDRGRRGDPEARGADAVRWDLVELRIATRTEAPELWVPNLAVMLERYRENQEASPVILSFLIESGLVMMAPHPDKPDDVLLDSRPLQAILAEYGPRVTTAAGGLGVAATKGGIWTPESAQGGGTTPGGIWTPGGGTSQPGGEKKLIIPGR